ncbi:TIGR03086 family protein [Amycolatopsis marina]|uniref:TIGR03086 family protein n=1 Tax=Amycolatopsis marina TaxID=490629 RepID=A0A1I1CHR0_9PSEU|nr:TIGR03086 family metal-binding protein [Amycolatopsis marina]SFB60438.1 TIGR03086 family protein [Amycolatopsis marina]
MDIRELDRRALEHLDKIVAGIGTADLTLPTPCAGWDLGDLMRHQVSENNAFAVAARHGSAEDWNGGDLGEDPYEAYATSVRAVLAAFDDHGMLDRQVTIHDFGPFPGAVVVSMHFIDSIVHGWDLASTLDAPYDPEPDLTAAALRIASQIPAGPDDRGAGKAFGAVVEVPGDSSDLDRVLGLLGRDPAWRP